MTIKAATTQIADTTTPLTIISASFAYRATSRSNQSSPAVKFTNRTYTTDSNRITRLQRQQSPGLTWNQPEEF